MLTIMLHNQLGPADLNIATGTFSLQRLLKNTNVNETARITREVPAGEVRLDYREAWGNIRCGLSPAFTAAAGQSYNVYVGDIAPPPIQPAGNFLQRIEAPPAPLGKCDITVRQIMPDGSEVPVMLHRYNDLTLSLPP